MKSKNTKGKKKKTMEDLTKGYEKFIEKKELDQEGAKKFDEVLKKAAKQPDSK